MRRRKAILCLGGVLLNCNEEASMIFALQSFKIMAPYLAECLKVYKEELTKQNIFTDDEICKLVASFQGVMLNAKSKE
jgi:hypothetical protein